VERQLLHDEARAVLTTALGDGSPRIRRLAALALSRSGAPEALAELRTVLETDSSEIRRLEVAFALARAGATEGTAALVEGLSRKRRDVRLEAARALALLGDARAVPRLREALSVNQLRLGAAESLARLGDAEAIGILREALGARVAETRMRAAVALGRAGDASGQALLRELIETSRVEIGADAALALLGDRDAAPSLTRALGLSALRVQAAVGLRRLGVEPDLSVLADALAASDEMGKISAAEAALVLCSPDPPAELR
jgi:HEAT repeat protein